MKSLEDCINDNGFEKGCYRYIKNFYKRKCTLKNRVAKILSNYEYVYFCTYTINEDYISCNIDFIRILKKILKDYNYIMNEDFGGKNGRLHYHILLGLNEFISYNDLSWKYGACNFKKVFNKNINALSNYINKLSNHTRKNRIVYSRKRRKK